jgi:hypothetical protein
MNTGMLWYDNDPRTALTIKVSRAADYYRKKYGRAADLCLVNPSMLTDRPGLVDGRAGKIMVRSNRAILPGHLWLGIEESK